MYNVNIIITNQNSIKNTTAEKNSATQKFAILFTILSYFAILFTILKKCCDKKKYCNSTKQHNKTQNIVRKRSKWS